MKNSNTLKSLVFLLSLFAVSACSKDDTPAKTTETISLTEEIGYYSFLSSVLPNTTVQEFNWDPALTMEIGYGFTPKVNGVITSIELKLPFVHGSTDVHIWDADTRNLIRTETLNMALAHTIIKKNISAVNLIANKKYLISVETNYWYRYQKSDPLKVSFPYTAGNINYNYAASSARDICPDKNLSETYLEGDVAFTFLKN